MFLIRWIIALLIACLVLPWCFHLLGDAWSSRKFIPRDGLAVMLGCGIGIAFILWKKPNWLIHTFIHESAHAITCLLLGVRIRNFQATDGRGGAVVHDRTGPIRSTIISLAPYTLPLTLIPLFLLHAIMSDPFYTSLLCGAISFTYIHHLHGLYHNVRLNFFGKQADLSKAGKPLSVACIISCWALVTTWTIKVLSYA